MIFEELNFNDTEPIYHQIIQFIKKNIANGNLRAGDKLLSVREMSKELGVNPNTLQRAYGELERMNITISKRGMGSFIVDDESRILEIKKELSEAIISKFLIEMNSIGINKEDAINLLKNCN